MTDRSQLQTATLMLEATSAEQLLNIAVTIPHQVIRLKSYRIQFADAPTAVLNPVVYLDLGGCYSVTHMVDNNLNRLFFPIFTSGSAITLETSCDIPINLSKDLPEKFNIRLMNSSFANLTFDRINLMFEYQISNTF